MSTTATFLQRVKSFVSGHPAVTLLGVVAISALLWVFFSGDGAEKIETIKAQVGDIQEIVSVTGIVEPADHVKLAFSTTGRVVSIPVSVGDSILRGGIVARLQGADSEAQLEKALAAVSLEQVKLDELKVGTRQEEIDVRKAVVENASVLVAEARKKLVDVNRDGFTKVDDAIHSKVDQFISNSRSASPQIDFSISNFQLEIDIESTRVTLERTLNDWAVSVGVLTTESNLQQVSSEARARMNQVLEFLDDVAVAVNDLSASANLTQASIDGYRSDVSTGRTNVNTALSNLTAAEEKLSSAEATLELEKSELTLTSAGATAEAIRAQEAKLREARASESIARADLTKTIITSPFFGTVTRVDIEVGEFVSQGEVVAEVISNSGFEIRTNVPEVDIAGLKIGDQAMVTLDAYGSGEVFSAVVSAIDPAETVVEGISTYTTTLVFGETDARIRSGMTANIDIVTAERTGVVIVPSRAVITRSGRTIVQILSAVGSIEEREVEVGIRGFEGNIEIVSGISQGEEVITFIPTD
jgi:RND family efflux transporter MFP subunit